MKNREKDELERNEEKIIDIDEFSLFSDERLKDVFPELDEMELILPPVDFTSNVMDKISQIDKKKEVWSRKAYKMWGSSLVAAGVFISIVNFSFADQDLDIKDYDLGGIRYTISREINKKLSTIDDVLQQLDNCIKYNIKSFFEK